jgi:hypothetical protein
MTTDQEPTTIAEAVASGDQLVAMRALANKLAGELDNEDRPPHTTAPISRELGRVLAAIADLEAQEPGETLEEALAAARESRLARTDDQVVRRG